MIEKYLNKVHCEDALSFMAKLPYNVIDCIITSPPYWGLRDYGLKPVVFGGRKDCEHLWTYKIDTTADLRYRAGKNSQVGNCLKKEIWQTDNKGSNICQKCGAWKGQLGLEPTFNQFIDNLIEIFAECKRVLKKEGTMWVNFGDTYNGTKNGNDDAKNNPVNTKSFTKQKSYLPTKSLCNIPSRFAIAMTDRLNMIQRNEIIWHKPNCMPSSVTDRFTVDFEKIYFFSKSKQYYFKMQKVPYSSGTIQRITSSPGTGSGMSYGTNNKREAKLKQLPTSLNPEGRNMRTVWKINSKPFKEAHFATFPEELVERCLMSGCPPKGIVYDPFMGACTVGLVALKNNINFIGTELNPDYIKIGEARIKEAEARIKQEQAQLKLPI